jgi:iron-sulfur cluster insertion protein
MSDVNLSLTESAEQKLHSLWVEANNPALHLRIYVEGGGCSGLQYQFTFDENKNEDDFTIETGEVKLLVDAISYQYLAGASIDYQQKLEGDSFKISNPNAKRTCGCGSSFTPNDTVNDTSEEK